MKCREFIDFIIDYLDGELPPEQAEAFKEHLELCPPCVEYVMSYKTTIVIEQLCCKHEESPPPQMPEPLVQAILRARKAGGGGEACGGASGGVGE
jgi:anti-sigma factor RsiW